MSLHQHAAAMFIEINDKKQTETLRLLSNLQPNEDIINNTDLVIEKLNTLNCSYTALPYPKNMNFLDLNVLDKFIEDINIAGSIFSKANKILCYHNHDDLLCLDERLSHPRDLKTCGFSIQ